MLYLSMLLWRRRRRVNFLSCLCELWGWSTSKESRREEEEVKARTYLSIAEPTDPNFLVLLRQNQANQEGQICLMPPRYEDHFETPSINKIVVFGWELVSLLKGSAIFIEGKTKIYAKYKLKLRYLSKINFLLRSSSLLLNVVLGK